MENERYSLSEQFKALWDKDSPMQEEWRKFEIMHWAIGEIAHHQAVKVSAFRNFAEIDQDIEASGHEKRKFVLEIFVVAWNRFLLRSCLKVRDSLELLFYSINTTNAYGCALAARSIIEHVAMVQYFAGTIPWRDNRTVPRNTMINFTKQFINLAQGSTFDWDKLLYGKMGMRALAASKSWKRPREQRIPPISKLVEALDSELRLTWGKNYPEASLQLVYAALCDVVHPSWGGDFIYAPNIHRDIKIERVFDEHFKKTGALFCIPLPAVVHKFSQLMESMMEYEPRMMAILKDLVTVKT